MNIQPRKTIRFATLSTEDKELFYKTFNRSRLPKEGREFWKVPAVGCGDVLSFGKSNGHYYLSFYDNEVKP